MGLNAAVYLFSGCCFCLLFHLFLLRFSHTAFHMPDLMQNMFHELMKKMRFKVQFASCSFFSMSLNH